MTGASTASARSAAPTGDDGQPAPREQRPNQYEAGLHLDRGADGARCAQHWLPVQ